MITVQVSYTVKPEFVKENIKNIGIFMEDFQKMNPNDVRYEVYLKSDGVTFVHNSVYKNEAIQNELLNVPSFKNFQKLRDESGLNDSHAVEVLQFIGASSSLL